jgi:hypothetical protein
MTRLGDITINKKSIGFLSPLEIKESVPELRTKRALLNQSELAIPSRHKAK